MTRSTLIFLAFVAAPSLALTTTSALAANTPTGSIKLGPAQPFSWDILVKKAKESANKPYQAPPNPLPNVVQLIDYDAIGKIHFRPESALYADLPDSYPISFFHLGRFNTKSVQMNVLSDGSSRELYYSTDLFTMPADSPARQLPSSAGFAGFQIKENKMRSDWRTEDWVAFQGASYFRAIGELHQYGLSARGIAIDVASAVHPEEFPDFTEFYFDQVNDWKRETIVYARLEGPSIAGAFKFTIHHAKGVVMDVEAALFMRKDVDRLGFAPLTSMYWFDAADKPTEADWRPAIHDSDGLSIWTGAGERLFRPLINPSRVMANAFVDKDVRGFGLLQRDRSPDHYLDGVNYESRPSLWVEPLGPWGEGSVQVIEIPTDDEIHDNIVAMWVPKEPVHAGQTFHIQYKLHWLADQPYWPTTLAKVAATRIGRGGNPGQPRPANAYRFAVEFTGGDLGTVIPASHLEAVVDPPSRGALTKVFVEPVPLTSRWRAVFDLQLADEDQSPINLRAYLKDVRGAMSETWIYQFHPPRAVLAP